MAHQRQQRVLGDQVDLIEHEHDRLLDARQQARHVVVPSSRFGRRIEHERDDVDFAQRFDCGVDHTHVEPVQRAMDPWRVDEHDLTVGVVLHRQNAIASGLRLVGDDRDLRPDDVVEERGLAGIRPTDEGYGAGARHYRRSTGASCARRKRTLWIRRRSASSTSTCKPSSSNVSPTAGTRPTRVST